MRFLSVCLFVCLESFAPLKNWSLICRCHHYRWRALAYVRHFRTGETFGFLSRFFLNWNGYIFSNFKDFYLHLFDLCKRKEKTIIEIKHCAHYYIPYKSTFVYTRFFGGIRQLFGRTAVSDWGPSYLCLISPSSRGCFAITFCNTYQLFPQPFQIIEKKCVMFK